MPNFNTREMKVRIYASVETHPPLPVNSINCLLNTIVYCILREENVEAVVSFLGHHLPETAWDDIATLMVNRDCRIVEDSPERLSFITPSNHVVTLHFQGGSGKIKNRLAAIEAAHEDIDDDDAFDAAANNLTQECNF